MPRLMRPVVLAVAPEPAQHRKGYAVQGFLGRMPNIGILYLAGMLEAAGRPVVTFDEQHEGTPPLMLASKINAQNPSLVGFTLYDVTMEPTHQTLSLLRLAYDGPIVVGGYTATFHAEDILRAWPEVDYVIVREGETALSSLVAYLEGTLPIEDVPNLVYRDGDSIRTNQESPLTDVNRIPWPRRQWPESGDVTPIVTRRGCMSRCAFCSMVPFYDLTLGPILRQRSPEDVVDEIAYCVDNGSEEFMIYDDDFGLSSRRERDWCTAFLECLQARDLDIHWGVELRVADVVRGAELLRDFCEVGLSHISIGLESMLPRQLKLYNKGYKQQDIFEAVEIARELPLDFQTNVIFWDPWITLDEAAEHIALLDRIRIQDQLGSANFPVFAGALIPRRGTAFYTLLDDAGLLRQRPGCFYRYEYDFVDSEVRTFYKGVRRVYVERVRAVDRPEALWLSVPRLEKAGLTDLGAAYRAYGRAVAQAEFDYFRALIEAACRRPAAEAFEHEVEEIHAHFGPQVDACAALLPEAAPAFV